MTHFSGAGHRPGKKGLLVLGALARSARRLSLSELMNAADIEPTNAKGRKFRYLVSAMVRDGLICCAWSNDAQTHLYWITDAGLSALCDLDTGCSVAVGGAPNVRLFARAA